MIYRKIIPSFVIVAYIVFGYIAFVHLLGIAWGCKAGIQGLIDMVWPVAIVGILGGFVLSMIASMFWPKLFYLWGLCYGCTTFLFALQYGFSVLILRKGVVGFFLWCGIGLSIYSGAILGGLAGRYIKGRLKPAN